jgi:DNA-binding transcriptional LysR family regulator
VALFTLSHFLPQFIEKHPKLEIKLKHDLSRRIAEEVISSSVDIGITVNPIKHPDLIITKICDDEVTFWSNGEDRPNLDIHSGSAVMICDTALSQTQNLLRQLKKNKINIGRTIESSNLEVITDLISSGCGIGILPTRVAQLAKTKKLKKILNSPVFKDEICILIRVENKNVKSIQALKEAIISSF